MATDLSKIGLHTRLTAVEATAGGSEDDITTLDGRVDDIETTLQDTYPTYSLSASTGNIGASSDGTFSIALPAGVTECLICSASIVRTAGTADGVIVVLDEVDTFDGVQRPFFGSMASSIDAATIVYGPVFSVGGTDLYTSVPYKNTSDSAFIRMTASNTDVANAGTWTVTVKIHTLP